MDRPLSTRSTADGFSFTTLSDSLPRGNTDASMVTAPKHPEPYLSIPAQALLQDNCRVHCGMIRKENKYKKWQDRYLVLHKGCLYYYKDSGDKKAKGQFSLSGYRLSLAPDRSKVQWTFKLTHIQPEKRTYYFAAHSEKERSEWFEKIKQDVNEYCDPRTPYNIGSCDSSSSSGGSSCGSSEEGDTYNYDYPEVSPGSVEEVKQRFLQTSSTAPVSIPGPSTAEYCPPPEFFKPSNAASKKGQLPPTPPTKPFHSVPGSTHGRGTVDVSRILKPDLSSSSSMPTNKAAVDIAQVLNQGIMQRKPSPRSTIRGNGVTSVSPQHIPLPPPKPRKTTQSSSSTDSSEEMYLELSNEAPEEPLPQQSALQRMRPDGNSFKSKTSEQSSVKDDDLLPPTALRLDYNKMDAIPLLVGYEGAYMIHSSTRGDINQTLSVCTGDKVKHYLIFYNQDGYALDPKGLRFPSVEAMLGHFHEKPLPNQAIAKLRMPYK